MAKNQCDGCCAGWPLNEHGTHYPPGWKRGDGYPNAISCTKHLYTAEDNNDANVFPASSFGAVQGD